MARKTPELNPLTDIPTKKIQVSKQFMLGYIKAHGTDEDKEWFKKLVRDNKVMKVSSLDHKEHKTLDIAPVREAFCERFFENVGKKPTKADDWFDEVESL